MTDDQIDDVMQRANDLLYPPLSAQEQNMFSLCEETIKKGLKLFLAVGTALMTIRDRRLYRTRFKTFEEYCLTRWDFTPRRAYQLVESAQVVANLKADPPRDDASDDEDVDGEEWKRDDPTVGTTVHIPLPSNERQCRPLTNLSPKDQRAA